MTEKMKLNLALISAMGHLADESSHGDAKEAVREHLLNGKSLKSYNGTQIAWLFVASAISGNSSLSAEIAKYISENA